MMVMDHFNKPVFFEGEQGLGRWGLLLQFPINHCAQIGKCIFEPRCCFQYDVIFSSAVSWWIVRVPVSGSQVQIVISDTWVRQQKFLARSIKNDSGIP